MREINHANFGMFGEPHLTKKQVYFIFINLYHANTIHNIPFQSVALDNDDDINNHTNANSGSIYGTMAFDENT